MGASDKSQSSLDGSSKKILGYASPNNSENDEELFVVTPGYMTWYRNGRSRVISPRCVAMKMEDFNNSVNMERKKSWKLVSPSRSPTARGLRNRFRNGATVRSPQKEARARYVVEKVPLSPAERSTRPPTGRSPRARDNSSRSPGRSNRESRGTRSSSRPRKMESRSKSRSRNCSRNRDDRRESGRSASRSRHHRNSSRSSSRIRHSPSRRDKRNSRGSRSLSRSGRASSKTQYEQSSCRSRSRSQGRSKKNSSHRQRCDSSSRVRSSSRSARSHRKVRRNSANGGHRTVTDYNSCSGTNSEREQSCSSFSTDLVKQLDKNFKGLPSPDRESAKVKASIVVQKIFRGKVGRDEYQRLLQARRDQILEEARRDKKNFQLKELKSMEKRIRDIQDQSKADVKKARDRFKENKRALKERARKKFEKMVQQLEDNRKTEEDAQDSLTFLEMSELSKQSKKLQSEIAGLESQICSMKEENLKLQQANNDISKLFDSLNDFAKKKTDAKKKLAAAIQKMSKVYKPKFKADIKMGTLAGRTEIKLRDLHRGYMYTIAQGVQRSDMYDQILYEEVVEMIQECEDSLGCVVLDLSQSIDYVNFAGHGCSGNEVSAEIDSTWDESKNFNKSALFDQGSYAWVDEEEAAAWGGSASLNASAKLDGSRLDSSSIWGDDDWASKWITDNDRTWTSGNLGDMLDKKLQLTDIDCQSHNSWRTEHESLMTWLD